MTANDAGPDTPDGRPDAVADHSLDDLIDGLYALAPSEFVAARNLAAKALRKEKRKVDADAVAKLVRPSATAALLNAAARSHPDLIAAVLQSGRRLRDVQTAVLSGSAPASLLKDASEQRRLAVREILGAAGIRADDAARTLEAASVDDELGQQLRRGRLAGAVTDAVGFSGGRTNADDDRFAAGLRLVAEVAPGAGDVTVGSYPAAAGSEPVAAATLSVTGGDGEQAGAESAAEIARDERAERERIAVERIAALDAARRAAADAGAHLVAERARNDDAVAAARAARARAGDLARAVEELREALARGEREFESESHEVDSADRKANDAAAALTAAEATHAARERELAALAMAAADQTRRPDVSRPDPAA